MIRHTSYSNYDHLPTMPTLLLIFRRSHNLPAAGLISVVNRILGSWSFDKDVPGAGLLFQTRNTTRSL
jgi:hypothetical protein